MAERHRIERARNGTKRKRLPMHPSAQRTRFQLRKRVCCKPELDGPLPLAPFAEFSLGIQQVTYRYSTDLPSTAPSLHSLR